MESHNWRCRECNKVISAYGLMSLSLSIRNHDRDDHGSLANRTLDEIEKSTQYWKIPNVWDESYRKPSEDLAKGKPASQYTEPNALCSGAQRPTYLEHQWLEKMRIKWDGDTRTPEELATRYKHY